MVSQDAYDSMILRAERAERELIEKRVIADTAERSLYLAQRLLRRTRTQAEMLLEALVAMLESTTGIPDPIDSPDHEFSKSGSSYVPNLTLKGIHRVLVATSNWIDAPTGKAVLR